MVSPLKFEGISHQYYTYLVAGNITEFVNMAHSVKFKMEIENFTDQPLKWVTCRIHSGHVQEPPLDIRPGFKEVFSGRKTSYSLTGVSATVVYRIGSSKKVLIVTIMCPFGFFPLSRGNALSLGIYTLDNDFLKSMDDDFMYNYMYKTDGPWKKRFYTRCDPLDANDDEKEYHVRGSMGTTHSASVTIRLYPTDENRLASSLKPTFFEQMKKQAKSNCSTS